jgi:hypothetical protein
MHLHTAARWGAKGRDMSRWEPMRRRHGVVPSGSAARTTIGYAKVMCPTEAPVDDVETPCPRPRHKVGRPSIEDSIELMMPAQFHMPASEAWPGEKRLMLAVLTDAIEILLKGPGTNGRRRGLYDETANWMRRNDTAWPYSFVNVCDVLGLDADAVRQTVARRLDERARLWCAGGLTARDRSERRLTATKPSAPEGKRKRLSSPAPQHACSTGARSRRATYACGFLTSTRAWGLQRRVHPPGVERWS